MKIVLDTNVLVSGILSREGAPGRILELVIEGEIILFMDTRIAYEYREVLSRPQWPFSKRDAFAVLEFILENSFWVKAEPLEGNLPDPEDLMFIEVAITAQAACIVTGNKRHFPKRAAGKIPVLSPSEFLRIIQTKD